MTPNLTKLKAVYERLQESFTMQNKLEFDQVVWATLPELWKAEVSTKKQKVGSKQQIGKRSMVRNYDELPTFNVKSEMCRNTLQKVIDLLVDQDWVEARVQSS